MKNKNCNECKSSNSFLCGKNNCNLICCPSCIIKHYTSCCYKVEVSKKIVPKDLEKDDDHERGHPYYKI